MIRRVLLGLLGALWLTGCGAPAEQDWGEPAPALWEATGPDGEQLWLLGTIHALPDGVSWRTDKLNDVTASADVLLVEIADLDTPQLQSVFSKLSTTAGQQPLSQRVAPADRAALLTLMDKAGMDDGDFASVETWAAALMLAGAVRQSDTANGVDRALINEVDMVVGMETIAGQLSIFDRLTEADQVDFLLLTTRSSMANDGQIAARAWHAGDMTALDRLVRRPLLDYPALHSALMINRHASWMATIEQQLALGQRPLVAVGAAHMLGEEGLPQMFAARGFAVQRVQ